MTLTLGAILGSTGIDPADAQPSATYSRVSTRPRACGASTRTPLGLRARTSSMSFQVRPSPRCDAIRAAVE